jgi:hypothetical protein
MYRDIYGDSYRVFAGNRPTGHGWVGEVTSSEGMRQALFPKHWASWKKIAPVG